MSTLDKAIMIAIKAHAGQKDLAGADYIGHPLRVMMSVGREDDKIVAVLHDVVEDGGVSLANLHGAGFSPAVVNAVNAVSRQPGEVYFDFIERCCKNPIARRVKVHDIFDNMDLSRIASPGPRDYERLKRYGKAMDIITESLLQEQEHD